MHEKTGPAGFGAESPEALPYPVPKSSDLLFAMQGRRLQQNSLSFNEWTG